MQSPEVIRMSCDPRIEVEPGRYITDIGGEDRHVVYDKKPRRLHPIYEDNPLRLRPCLPAKQPGIATIDCQFHFFYK